MKLQQHLLRFKVEFCCQ